ncbi:phosphatase 2C-like domain-containing protein [Rhodocollybia butyracea]|uniref:Phosphatase 2C-like domain-containing protein n=1 Tax=Rhodocollybia butyracea TaxID=206335 RepID=A0A9P5PI63_9AGAR|nr:phosphatase 2C-like domain-containing protein [Rhodocollybia butyracea]
MPLSSIELDTAYSLKSSHSINVSSGARISQATFQPLKPCNEDRTVFVERGGLGFIVGVFDGHYTQELSDYASRTLPKLLLDRIADATATPGTDFSDAVTTSLVEGIKDFDASLLQNLLSHFPGVDKPEWWLEPRWDDRAEMYKCIGYSNEDSRFREARRAVVGSTLLIAFVDEGRKHVWVASLGDSEAAVGNVNRDGSIDNLNRLSDFHNARNPDEVARLQREHPNEPFIRGNRVLGALGVTRALGDYLLKVPFTLSLRILTWIYRSPIPPFELDKLNKEFKTPPYLSSSATVHHRPLHEGDVLVLFSDGLADRLASFDETEKHSLVLSLANADRVPMANETTWAETFGHDFILPEPEDCPAERVIKNICFGTSLEKKTEVVLKEWDDISVVVVQF